MLGWRSVVKKMDEILNVLSAEGVAELLGWFESFSDILRVAKMISDFIHNFVVCPQFTLYKLNISDMQPFHLAVVHMNKIIKVAPLDLVSVD